DVEREAGTQLVLQREGALPVVATVTETGKRVGAEPRFVGRQAKPCRRQRTAFAVGGGQYQVAVGNEVGVGISPRAVGAVHLLVCRVPELREIGADQRHVSSQRRFHGGLAVAEQIVRGTEPRAQIRVVRQILRLRIVSRRDEDACGG